MIENFVIHYKMNCLFFLECCIGVETTIEGVDIAYTCFFCTIPLEDNMHRLIKCPIMCVIWKYSSDIWQVFNPLLFEASTMGVFLLRSKWSKWWARDIVLVFTILGTATQLEYAWCIHVWKLMADIGESIYEEVERHSYGEFLDVRTCGDYYLLECMFKFYVSFITCPSLYIG